MAAAAAEGRPGAFRAPPDQPRSSLSWPSSRARSRTSRCGHSESRCATRLRRPSRERVTDARPEGVQLQQPGPGVAEVRHPLDQAEPLELADVAARRGLVQVERRADVGRADPLGHRAGQLEHADQHRVARGVEVRVHLGGHGLRRRPRPAQEPGDLPLDVVQACRHGRRWWGRRGAGHRRSLPTPPVTAANLLGLRAVTSQTCRVCAPPPRKPGGSARRHLSSAQRNPHPQVRAGGLRPTDGRRQALGVQGDRQAGGGDARG